MPKISDVKDIYLDNVAFCKKEDMMKMPKDAYVLAAPEISVPTEQITILSSKIKNTYLETPKGVSVIPEAVLKTATNLTNGKSCEISKFSFNKNDYLKIIIFNASDQKKPIYYELFNMDNSNWKFVESFDVNGTKGDASKLETYGISLMNDSTTTRITLNSPTYIACVKQFNSKK